MKGTRETMSNDYWLFLHAVLTLYSTPRRRYEIFETGRIVVLVLYYKELDREKERGRKRVREKVRIKFVLNEEKNFCRRKNNLGTYIRVAEILSIIPIIELYYF